MVESKFWQVQMKTSLDSNHWQIKRISAITPKTGLAYLLSHYRLFIAVRKFSAREKLH